MLKLLATQGQVQRVVGEQVQWNKISVSRYKCNVDASFSHSLNKVDIRICIRDEEGRFVLSSPKWKGLHHYLT